MKMAIDENMVPGLQAMIRDLEQELVDTKRMLNRALIRQGKPPFYSEAALSTDGAGSVFAIRTDQFYKQGLGTSIREFLKMRKAANLGPASLSEIYDALVRGGFAFETGNEDNRKRNLRANLTKSTALFHRLPDGVHFGLTEWYPELKVPGEEPASKKQNRRKGKKTAEKKKATPATKTEEKPDKAAKAEVATVATKDTNGATVLETVKAAIMAMSGEFTKQQVVDWIEKHHPTMKAEQRKSSIFSMIAKLKDELKLTTAHAGKGKEPHRFKREA
jgi:hypothetical protein